MAHNFSEHCKIQCSIPTETKTDDLSCHRPIKWRTRSVLWRRSRGQTAGRGQRACSTTAAEAPTPEKGNCPFWPAAAALPLFLRARILRVSSPFTISPFFGSLLLHWRQAAGVRAPPPPLREIAGRRGFSLPCPLPVLLPTLCLPLPAFSRSRRTGMPALA